MISAPAKSYPHVCYERWQGPRAGEEIAEENQHLEISEKGHVGRC